MDALTYRWTRLLLLLGCPALVLWGCALGTPSAVPVAQETDAHGCVRPTQAVVLNPTEMEVASNFLSIAYGLPLLAESLSLLGQIHLSQGRYEEAELIMERALKVVKAVAQPNDFGINTMLKGLANVY